MEDILFKHVKSFKNLNRGFNKGLGRAPHKPILLLSIIQLIEKGHFNSNRIFITPELVSTFKNIWSKLVYTNHTPNFSLPFFHMRSEPFWFLVTKPGMEISLNKSKSIKSFKNLKDSIAFAEIDKELFFLLKNDDLTRNFLLDVLLMEYFQSTKNNYALTLVNEEECKIEKEILNEPKEDYQKHIQELKRVLDEDNFQEEIFIRGGLFKKTIPKIYNYKCCISGMKIDNIQNIQMVDACHIIPFSLSFDDTIPNGISLSPNLHRAFDRGLITINKEYIIRLSPTVIENDSSYSITQFEGNKILLPDKVVWYPSPESLGWHNKEVYIL
jgi:putative restriction endonuclease